MNQTSTGEPDVLVHGVLARRAPGDVVDRMTEELLVDGYTVVDGGYSSVQLDDLAARLDDIYERQVEEIGGPGAMEAANDKDVVRAPLAYDPAFIEVATNPALMAVLRRVLGENFVLTQQNGISNKPGEGNYQVRWHRDLSYQHWTSSEPIAVNALLCIDDFTAERGATHVLAGTHRVADFPSDHYVRGHQKPVEAARGSFLLLDAMLFHRAGINRTQLPRRAVNHLVGRPFLAQQFDLPSMLGERYASDPFLSRYLGYRWRPAPSPAEWRRSRINPPSTTR